MSSYESRGKLITCRRGGAALFLKYIGRGETDGGYTTWDKFEDIPKTWLYQSQFGYLCHDCAKIFRTFVCDLIGEGGSIAPVWDKRIHDEPSDVKMLDKNVFVIDKKG